MNTARSRAVDTAQLLNDRASRQHARYTEHGAQERALYKMLREAAETTSVVRHLDSEQLTAVERHLKGLRLEADMQAGRAHDVVKAATELIDAVTAEQRARS